MNLQAITVGAIAAVNPQVDCWLQRSAGYQEGDDGVQIPVYGAPVVMPCQIQSLTYDELRLLDGLNIQGVRRAIYLQGYWAGVVRPDRRGGDLVVFPDNTAWLCVHALETWADWSKIAVTQQMGGAVLNPGTGQFYIPAA